MSTTRATPLQRMTGTVASISASGPEGSVASRRAVLADVRAALHQPTSARYDFFVNNEGNALRALHGIQGLGGGYLGIGTEVNFTYAAAARSSFMILCDVTADVGLLHELYRALHLLAPRRQDFVRYAFFAPNDAKLDTTNTARLLDSAFHAGIGKHHTDGRFAGNDDVLDRVARPIASAGHMTLERARAAARLLAEVAPTLRSNLAGFDENLRQRSWVASDASYEHIRKLFVDERVLIVTRDITALDTPARARLAKAHAELGPEPLRVVYLSNVPDYLEGEPHDLLCASLRAYGQLDWQKGALIKSRIGSSGQPLYALSKLDDATVLDMTTTVHALDTYVASDVTRDPFSDECRALPEIRAMQRHDARGPLARALIAGIEQTKPPTSAAELTSLIQGALAALER